MASDIKFGSVAEKQAYFKAQRDYQNATTVRAKVLKVAEAACGLDGSKNDWSGQGQDDKVVLDGARVKGEVRGFLTGQMTMRRPSGDNAKNSEPVDMSFEVKSGVLKPGTWFSKFPGSTYTISTDANGNKTYGITTLGDYGGKHEWAYEGPDGNLLNPQVAPQVVVETKAAVVAPTV